VITAPGDDTLRVNITGRPQATGVVLDSTTIIVSFPDDTTYTAKLTAPGTIRWSNGSTWTKLTIRVPNLHGLEQPEASAAIVQAGLTVGSVRSVIDRNCGYDGTVRSQNPSANTFAVAGQRVDYVLGQLPDTPCP
jgi:beta-lactam-binding protein with PASTA domain